MKLTREILQDRHRLSDRQINDFLDEQEHSENREERLLAMQRIGTFLEITDVLNTQNIWFLNLKGPLLSERIYGDPTYRYFRDFDILVKPKDVNRTLRLLEKRGYIYPGFKWPESKKKQKITLHFINQVEMVHEESGVMFEIHWKLFSTRITNQRTINRLLEQNMELVEFGGQKLKRLSLEFELFYLIAHGGNHAWFRLKWLVDIHEILNRKNNVDWKIFNRIVSECRAQRLVNICNTLLREFFPGEQTLPQTKMGFHNLGKFAISQSRQPEGDPHITRFNTFKLTLYRLMLYPHWRHKVDVVKVITFCKTDLKYEWLPPYRFVYYLFRPVGYVLRRAGILK